MKTSHLSDEQLVTALLGAPDAATLEHLAACDACRRASEKLQAAVASLRASAQAAQRPEGFWRSQRNAIAARLEGGSRLKLHPLAWASAAALVALAVVLLRSPAPPPAAPAPDPDHMLMVDVQQTLRREVPEALAPAALLAQEMGQTLDTSPRLRQPPERRLQ